MGRLDQGGSSGHGEKGLDFGFGNGFLFLDFHTFVPFTLFSFLGSAFSLSLRPESSLSVGLKSCPQHLPQHPGQGLCTGQQAPVLPRNRLMSGAAWQPSPIPGSLSHREEAAVSKNIVMDSY